MTTTRTEDLSQSMTLRDPFAAAVLNWISEATSAYAAACGSDAGRRIMADACCRCWDAYFHEADHDAAPAARAAEPEPAAALRRPAYGTGDTPVTEPMPKEKRAEVSGTLTEPVADSDELLAEYLLWKTRRCEPQPLAAGWRAENRTDGSGNRQSPDPSPVRSSPAPAARATEQARSPDQSPRGTGDTPRVQPAIDRLREWERHGSGRWGLGAAGDVTMLERRLAIVEAIVHDAAPATRAHVDAAGISRHGTGDTKREPVAWVVMEPHGIDSTFRNRDEASEWCGEGQEIVPLHRDQPPPTLTDAERAAIQWCVGDAMSVDGVSIEETLRGLLERTK